MRPTTTPIGVRTSSNGLAIRMVVGWANPRARGQEGSDAILSLSLAAHKLRLRPLADPLSSAACDFPRIQRATDRYSEPGLFSPGRRLPVGLSRAHGRP